MKKLLAAAILAGVFASATAKTEQKEILAAREAVKNYLKDPDSAKFKGEMLSGTIVCGEVNAKNSYGGYGGSKRYMVQDGMVTLESQEYPLFDRWWSDNCYK